MSDENLAEIRNEKAKKVQHPKGKLTAYERVELLLDEGFIFRDRSTCCIRGES